MRIVTGWPCIASIVAFMSAFMNGYSSSRALRRSSRVLLAIILRKEEERLVGAFAVEHVLGAEQADAFGAELQRLLRVLRRVGVRAHAELPETVHPLHELP